MVHFRVRPFEALLLGRGRDQRDVVADHLRFGFRERSRKGGNAPGGSELVPATSPHSNRQSAPAHTPPHMSPSHGPPPQLVFGTHTYVISCSSAAPRMRGPTRRFGTPPTSVASRTVLTLRGRAGATLYTANDRILPSGGCHARRVGRCARSGGAHRDG